MAVRTEHLPGVPRAVDARPRRQLADDRRPQADRDPLHRDVPPLLRGRRRDGRPHAHPARAAERRLHRARALQRALHDPRHHDGLPGRGADPRGLRQLHGAADDRRAGHGVPAPERGLVLALPVRRHRPVHELLRQGRAGGHRLDDLPALLGHQGRRRDRPAHPLAPHPHDRLAARRDQLPRHDPPHAHRWDDVDAAAALRLVDRGLRGLARRGAAGALSGTDDAAPRPAGRARTSSCPRRAGTPSSSSTSSGSSGTPRCTS